MKKMILILLLAMGFISCSDGAKTVQPQDQQTLEASAENPADCDDKIEDFGKKEVAEISLDGPQDGGCTLE